MAKKTPKGLPERLYFSEKNCINIPKLLKAEKTAIKILAENDIDYAESLNTMMKMGKNGGTIPKGTSLIEMRVIADTLTILFMALFLFRDKDYTKPLLEVEDIDKHLMVVRKESFHNAEAIAHIQTKFKANERYFDLVSGTPTQTLEEHDTHAQGVGSSKKT